MKKSFQIAAVVGLLAVVFLFSACPWERKHGIVILPVPKAHVQLQEKWTSVENVLTHYNDEIYLIRTYNHGTPVPKDTLGKMDELLLERPIKKFDELAAGSGYTGHAVQIGVGLAKAESDVRFIGTEPEGRNADDQDKSDQSPQPSPSRADSSGKSPSPSRTVAVVGRTSSHAHLIQLVDESAELVKEIDPIIDGSGDSNDKH